MANEKTSLLDNRTEQSNTRYDDQVNEESLIRKKDNGYSWQVGFVYVFNIMVGAGLLALPKAFAEVGWLLGLISLGVCALMSFITVTFVIEALSLANILLRHNKSQKECLHLGNKTMLEPGDVGILNDQTGDYSLRANTEELSAEPKGNTRSCNKHTRYTEDDYSKDTRYIEDDYSNQCPAYDIKINVELGEMSKLFFNRTGVILYYMSICLYIYGTTTVYIVVIGKSMTTVVCDDPRSFIGDSATPCKRFKDITVVRMYRYMLAILVVCVTPFAYLDIKNTKCLQIFTTGYRWFSMISMVILAFLKIGKGDGIPGHLNLFVLDKLPRFFGMALYAFMCQHSIPAVTSPVTNQERVTFLLGLDFISTLTFYTVTLMTSVFAFSEDTIQDVYTLNFTEPVFFRYLLQLFPVLTLSTTVPVFAIVLRNNIRKCFSRERENNLDRFIFSSIAIIPPLIIAFLTHDVASLVRYTGSYAGTIIQYVVPTLLVFFGRRTIKNIYGEYVSRENRHRSPFGSEFWIWFILIWYLLCVVVVTYDNIKGR